MKSADMRWSASQLARNALLLPMLLLLAAGAAAQTAGAATDFSAALESLLKGCQLPRPIAIYFTVRRQTEAQQKGFPASKQSEDTAEILYLDGVSWRGNAVDFIQYEQRDNRTHWRMLVQFRNSDQEIFKAFYQPLNASRAMIAKDGGISTGFLQFNGKTSVICQNSLGPWMTGVVASSGAGAPQPPAPALPDPYIHPTILTTGELTAVAGWNRAQWEAYMRPLLAANGGRLTCRPPLLMHAFIPPPYDRLITDHSLICE